MFGSFLGKIKLLAKSPMTLFVYGILGKWFITTFITAIIVVYWVFKGLSDSKILLLAEEVVFDAFNQTKSVARYCVPKIGTLEDFWSCLQDPQQHKNYIPTEEELEIEQGVKKFIDPTNSFTPKDPYTPDN